MTSYLPAVAPATGKPRHAVTDPADDRAAAACHLESDIRERHRSLLRDLRIEVVAGGVVLHGHADTFYGKQVAQQEVMRRAITVVANRIVVAR
jgi:hypothetical protein